MVEFAGTQEARTQRANAPDYRSMDREKPQRREGTPSRREMHGSQREHVHRKQQRRGVKRGRGRRNIRANGRGGGTPTSEGAGGAGARRYS